MHWLLQENISTPEQLEPYIKGLESIKRLGATWSFVKLIPFVGEVIPDDDYTGKKVFALGSTSLITAAQKRNWKPGVIFDENTFRYEAWEKGWGKENLLNGGGEVSRFANVRIDGPTFIRPCEDQKIFTGRVIEEDELTKWQFCINEGDKSSNAYALTNDTMVMFAPVKRILREWRFFVVGGKVISGSQYRDSFGLCESADVDSYVYDYAQEMANRWRPADCFVLDIAGTPSVKDGYELSILEVNCLNGSGLYQCDANKIFGAIEQLYENTKS
jgi:ATP-grasp domain, R2K clade family 3